MQTASPLNLFFLLEMLQSKELETLMPSPRKTYFIKLFLVFALYFFTGKLGLAISPVSRFATLVWPPTGISLAALLLGGRRLWPAITLGAFAVNLANGASGTMASALALGNTLEALVGANLLQRTTGFRNSMEGVGDVFALTIFAALLSTTLSATVGALSLWFGRVITPESFVHTWRTWWVGDALGVLIVAPLILAWATRSPTRFRIRGFLEGFALIFALVLISVFVFSGTATHNFGGYPMTYLVFLPLIWAAWRFPRHIVMTAIFTTFSIAVWKTSQGLGPFVHSELSYNLLFLQIFMGVVSVTVMLLSSVVGERAKLTKLIEAELSVQKKIQEDLLESERETNTRATQQAALAELGHKALTGMTLDALMKETVRCVAETLSVEFCKVLELDQERNVLLLKAGVGWKEGLVGHTVLPTSTESQAGYALLSREPVIVRDFHQETRFAESSLLQDHGVTSGMSVILYSKNKPFGVLGAHSRDPREFTKNDVNFLQSVANVLSTAIERHEVEEELLVNSQELARSNADLEQFAYVASHDLQEPLRMVTSYLQLLERRYEGKLDKNAEEFIDYAVDGAMRMHVLINDLLTYSRVTKQGATKVPISCESVMETVAANLKSVVKESQAEIFVTPLPAVLGSEVQLVQLFQNLISNALKFRSQEPPRIRVSAEMKDSNWLFSVADNGIGIEPEYREKIFVIFQRLHARTRYPGTGIGLAICKKIVEQHGGKIWVDSQPGQGSTFYFTLPVLPQEHISLAKTQKEKPLQETKK